MNTVVYSEDFEPIIVLDLPLWLLERAGQLGCVRVPVQDDPSAPEPFRRTVLIRCEKIAWKGSLRPVFVTPDEELILLAKTEWLPGQRATVSGYKHSIKTLTERLVKAMRKN